MDAPQQATRHVMARRKEEPHMKQRHRFRVDCSEYLAELEYVGHDSGAYADAMDGIEDLLTGEGEDVIADTVVQETDARLEADSSVAFEYARLDHDAQEGVIGIQSVYQQLNDDGQDSIYTALTAAVDEAIGQIDWDRAPQPEYQLEPEDAVDETIMGTIRLTYPAGPRSGT